MSEAHICLKPIHALLNERFYVPDYQRGYRWNERQVSNLLDDLWEFQAQADSQDRSAFYCLQPVVVLKREDGQWELVDGQQRLTTIFIILSCMKNMMIMLGKQPFSLNFATRETSGAFLQDIADERAGENIDFYHICAARAVIQRWLAGRDSSHRLKLLQCLLNDDELGKNVKVIWYELPPNAKAVDAFTRLNVGKIALSNAELIRALFLRKGNFDNARGELQRSAIAQEWDDIERKLQDDALWYFLHRDGANPASRIEYLFQLIALETEGGTDTTHDHFETFYFYQRQLTRAGNDVATEWLKVKQYFMRLEEWFADRTLYHLVGFLVQDGDKLIELRKLARNCSKKNLQRLLKQRIYRRLLSHAMPPDPSVDILSGEIDAMLQDLDYDRNKAREKIFSTLLAFNIATLLQNEKSNLRFPFDLFKLGSWDIEHLRAIASDRPKSAPERIRWLCDLLDYLAWDAHSFELRDHLKDLLDGLKKANQSAMPALNERFNQMYDQVLEHFGESAEAAANNSIGNLALLDSTTNRSYRNAVFPVKRKTIIDRDKEGVFVPVCTRNAFMKCYSRKIGNMMFWTADDREDYQEAIASTLAHFFLDGGNA
jgi:hypothetical protein